MLSPEFIAAGLFFLAALLYTCVGHGGASGYLAILAFLGFAPAVLRTTSLSLNIVAASIALVLFMQRHAKTMEWRLLGTFLLPFAGLGVPMAYLGGSIALPGGTYRYVLGVAVLWAAWTLLKPFNAADTDALPIARSRLWMWPAGAVIGFLSGLTGIGGGIFLSPLLVLTGALGPKHSAPVSAALILLNSASGLIGVGLAGAANWVPELPIWMVGVASGAVLGAYFGSRKLSPLWLRRLLALVLAIAAFKLLGVFGLFSA